MNLLPELPLVQAWMMLRAHPSHPGFDRERFVRPEQAASVPAADVGPQLERMFLAAPPRWDLRALEELLLSNAQANVGDVLVDPEWTLAEIHPGAHVGTLLDPLVTTLILEGFGVFEPGFRRANALAGEWWLLQPTNPHLEIYTLADRFGLHCAGVLPTRSGFAGGPRCSGIPARRRSATRRSISNA